MDGKLKCYPVPEQNVFVPNLREPDPYYEKDLLKQWFQLPIGLALETAEGRSLTIIHHGRRNRNKGPDIKNAILFIQSNIVKGDIECHIMERDWYTHHHENDQNYNRVILHIIHTPMYKIKGPLENTLVLKLNRKNDCTLTKQNVSGEYHHILLNLREKRWGEHLQSVSKKNHFTILANVLGKGGNEENFKRLVNQLDAERLIRLTKKKQLRMVESLSRSINIDWEHCGIRPAHWPERRLSLLIELIAFISQIKNGAFTDYESFFQVYSSHCTSGGKGILTECSINYFIPWMALDALNNNNIETYTSWKNSWGRLCLQYPYGVIHNKFGAVFTRKELTNVGNTQGLLYLNSHYCQKEFCIVCPLKKRKYDWCMN
ncbi:MAG: DUF2851 family protein [Fidelibacterota bacterium]